MFYNNTQILHTIAGGLDDLKNEVVFIGGIVISLYSDNPGSSDIRATNDVDCVIELSSRQEYFDLETALRSKGFRNDNSKGAPICRWIYKEIIVDVMPTDEKILGFTNKWYIEGIENKILKKLPSGTEIFMFSPEYFLASKFAAHHSRGGNDLRQSKDFEDIIYILDNVSEITDIIKKSKISVKNYLKEECFQLLDREDINEGIECALPYGSSEASTQIILEIIKK